MSGGRNLHKAPEAGQSPLRDALQPVTSGERPEAARVTRLRAPGVDPEQAAAGLVRWFDGEGFEAQVVPGERGGHHVQARTKSLVRRAVGASSAMSVLLRAEGGDLVVEMGRTTWVAKGAIGGVALVATAPYLALPAAWGTVQQLRLPGRVLRFLTATMPTYLCGTHTTAPAPDVANTPTRRRREPIDPNVADAETLGSLSGLGDNVSEVVRRRRTAPFRSREDLAQRLADLVPPAAMRDLLAQVTIASTGPAPEPGPGTTGRQFG